MKHEVGVSAAKAATQVAVEASVIRCGCGDPMSHAALQQPCPRPRAVEPRGTVAYYHRSAFIRWCYRMSRRLGLSTFWLGRS